MRGELRSDLRQRAAEGPRDAADAPSGAEGQSGALGAARRAAWMPILARVAAGAIALVGLAAIGVAARKSPELTSLVPQPPLGLAQLSGPVAAVPHSVEGERRSVEDESAGHASTGDSAVPAAAPALPEQPAPAPASDVERRPCAAPAASPATAAGASAVSVAPAQRSVSAPSSATPGSVSQRAGAGHSAGAAPPLVDLNSADVRQLQRLPGVGAKRAQAIVELRERLGGFRRTSDLLRLRGIGKRTLERMAPQLVIGAKGEDAPVAAQPSSLTEPPRAEPIPPRSAAR